jgi:hypothetical protein
MHGSHNSSRARDFRVFRCVEVREIREIAVDFGGRDRALLDGGIALGPRDDGTSG